MEPGGNDFPLSKLNVNGYNTQVKDWTETYNRLLLVKAIGILE